MKTEFKIKLTVDKSNGRDDFSILLMQRNYADDDGLNTWFGTMSFITSRKKLLRIGKESQNSVFGKDNLFTSILQRGRTTNLVRFVSPNAQTLILFVAWSHLSNNSDLASAKTYSAANTGTLPKLVIHPKHLSWCVVSGDDDAFHPGLVESFRTTLIL